MELWQHNNNIRLKRGNICFYECCWTGNWKFWVTKPHVSCTKYISCFPPRQIMTSIEAFIFPYTTTHTHTQYLCQPHVLLLNGILQTVAQGSGQQQICRLADHVIHLSRTVHTRTYQTTYTHARTHRDNSRKPVIMQKWFLPFLK